MGRHANGRWVAGAVMAPLVVSGLLVGCSPLPSTSSGGGVAASGQAPGASATSSARVSAPQGGGAVMPTGHQKFIAISTDVGRLVVTKLTGAQSGVTLRVWVWMPPQYDQPAYAHTAFPALMLYPGGSGAGYNTWAGQKYGAREADAAGATRGTLTPFVFVMPEMQLSERLDTECADVPGQPKIGTFLSADVRQMVQDNFRVIHDRMGWAAAGASAGAYCASRLVFNHPDQYAAVVSISGYFSIETNLRGANDPLVRAQDPAAIAVAHPPQVSALLWSGSRPGPDLSDARGFLAKVRPPTSAELRILPGGRHLTSDFAKMMPASLAWLTAHLARPTPAP